MMTPTRLWSRAIRTAYLKHLKASKVKVDLSHYDLDKLVRGEPTVLYHGTTATFNRFRLDTSRDELVDQFYGKGIFFSPRKKVAQKYAYANRNKGLPKSVIDEISSVDRESGDFLRSLFEKGRDAWPEYEEKGFDLGSLKLDANSLMDISMNILGTAYTPGGGKSTMDELSEVFFGNSDTTPEWVYDLLDRLGVDSNLYRPKVYTSIVTVSNPLVTASTSEAKKARSKGYDSVVFCGRDLVDGVPEVAIFDPSLAKISHVEVL